VRRTTTRQRELRAIMRAAIAEELRELYRVQQDEPYQSDSRTYCGNWTRERIQQVQANPHRSQKVT
jgi:hypothetical protein